MWCVLALAAHWGMILLLLAFPAMIGFLVVPERFLRRYLCMAGGVVALVFLTAFAFGAPYTWALYLESRWSPAQPKTKVELESFLSLYSQHRIQPSESMWGNRHELKPGEYMNQYLLLGSAPLDVVYTPTGTIVSIYTSHE